MNQFFSALYLTAIFISLPALAAADPAAYGPLLPLHVAERRIVDSAGSAVILRGVNVNQLGDYFQANPKIPATIPLTRRDFEQMAELGIDSVRLIVTWSALEPERGRFDAAYLARVKEAVGWARDNGIYVVLDMHQDAWGKSIASDPDQECPWPLTPNIGWDGAPEWATITDGRQRCMLIHREISFAVWRAFQSFWTNRDGIQDRFIATWAWLAAEFKSDPTVVGYDLLNEPNWGTDYARTLYKLMPDFYRRATAEIRKAEAGGSHKIVFFEPIIVWSVLPGQQPVRFTSDPDIVYAPHIYLGSISIDMFTIGREVMPLRSGFKLAAREAAGYRTTFWDGEWMYGPGDHPQRMAALEDEYQVGSARWLWKMSCGDPHRMAEYWPARDRGPEGESHNVIVTRCGDPQNPAGVEVGVNETDRMILARPYPRAFPAPAKWTTDPKARMIEISGVAAKPGVPLRVWVPGPAEPEVTASGLGEVGRARVPGGWVLSAAPPAGAWRLEARGSMP